MKSYKDYPKINNDRINFSKISGKHELPNLVAIQTDSYKKFLESGIDSVLNEIFPIVNNAQTLSIEYDRSNGGIHLAEPKYNPLECKERDLTYQSSLTVDLVLRYEDGNIKPDTVFMGDIPLMTNSGTFIINGAERVIISQIVRAPGAYLKIEEDKKTGNNTYHIDLNPTHGTRLEFDSDLKNLLWCRIDRAKKLPATVLLKAVGLDTDEKITDIFGHIDALDNTLSKDTATTSSLGALKEIFRKLKNGEVVTDQGSYEFLNRKFFNNKTCSLGAENVGRVKYAKKLGVYERLIGATLAEDLVDEDGEKLYAAGTRLTKDDVKKLQAAEFFSTNNRFEISVDPKIDPESEGKGYINIVKIYKPSTLRRRKRSDNNPATAPKVINVVGTDLTSNATRAIVPDILATFSYFLNLMDGVGKVDDIDRLSNRRLKCVGELIENQFKQGLLKMAKTVVSKMSITNIEPKELTAKSLINIRPLTTAVRDFFSSSQLSQFMDQTNPLAELANKRRISALGPGGLARDRASMEVRDVHNTHYGRICPIETPEGQNIGLINNLATYAQVDKYGFLKTPYRKYDKVNNKILEDEPNVYLTADEEEDYIIANATSSIADSKIVTERCLARKDGESLIANREDVDLVDESPMQIVSIAAACIPFLENDDNTRALMGANMQRQALPLLNPHAPYVGTGIESSIARDCGLAVLAENDGIVKYTDSQRIIVSEADGNEHEYLLQKFKRSNQGTCINQNSIVKIGQEVKKGQVIADGPSMDNGDLALGQNVTIAFMTWEGYNYEDAIVMSERLMKDDVYTTIHIESYEVECRDTANGVELLTADVPNISKEQKSRLDEYGIVTIGTDVKEGDILVGKVTPKGTTEQTGIEKILGVIFGDKAKDGKDTSLKVPHGGAGTVLAVKVFVRDRLEEDFSNLPAGIVEVTNELAPGVRVKVRVYVVQKRKISEGDKMSGRHGNKGVISRILPVEDMPYMEDGTPVDIMLNPQGVPSRMNIGQVLEVHLGMALKKLGGVKIATPVFDGMSNEEIYEIMEEAKCSKDGKYTLYDGRTGEKFDNRITVGVMYMIKLVHMVDDKIHARATGTYTLVTQQPLGGKAQNGGQRFGEMEVWALEAYGAAYTLQEMLTIKSDDRVGRRRTYEAIIKGEPIPRPSIPEAFKVLTKELMGLGLDVELRKDDGTVIDMEKLARDTEKEEKLSMAAIRNYGEKSHSNLDEEEEDELEKTKETYESLTEDEDKNELLN